jgi:hypothetical protein
MSSKTLTAVCLSLVFSPPGACAADLTKLERPVLKEPVYHSNPKYCLLVFGPEANIKIWLVQDGDVLYVDRNGNGDVTEAGKRFTAERRQDGDDNLVFKVGDVQGGPRLHKELTVVVRKFDDMVLAKQDEFVKALVAKNPKARGYFVSIEMDMPGWKGQGIDGRVRQHAFYVDLHGIFQFAKRPADAPIVNFGGPLHVALFSEHRLTIGRETDMVLGVGTPGVGPGATAWIDYDGVIPANAYPTIDIAYPPKREGEPPVSEHYMLKRRC